MSEQEIKLREEGMWVSGIIKNLDIEEIDNSSPTKTALFYALYQGPIEDEEG